MMQNRNSENTGKQTADPTRMERRLRAALIRIIAASVLFLCLFILGMLQWEPFMQTHDIKKQSIAANAPVEALEAAAERILSGK